MSHLLVLVLVLVLVSVLASQHNFAAIVYANWVTDRENWAKIDRVHTF